MAVIHWTNSAGGNWSLATNWSAGVPQSGDDAVIDTIPNGYTVTVDGNYTIDSIGVIAGVVLTTSYSHTFTITDTNTSSVNAGVVDVTNYSNLLLGGTMVNSDTIADLGSSNATSIEIAAALVTLSGGGLVTLNDDGNYNAIISAATSGNKLVNVNNTISGGGTLGANGLAIDNRAAGVINANGTNSALVITGAGTFTNEGLIEATNTAGLVLRGVGVTNTGTVLGNGGTVYLENTTIAGGTLNGQVATVSSYFGSTLDGSAANIVNNGTVTLINYSGLSLVGSIVNNGRISDLGTGNTTYIYVAGAAVTLTGGGKVTLNDDGNYAAVIAATTAGNKLVNVNNSISGGGTLGQSGLAIDNQAAGVINANGTNSALVITGAGTFTNEGLIEATNTAGLVLRGVGVTNTGTVLGSGGTVYLENSTIAGGILNGQVATVSSYFGSTLDGSAANIVNNGTVTLVNYSGLSLLGTINNVGVISDLGSANNTYIYIASAAVSLIGAGQVQLADTGSAIITGDATNDLLVNVNNTISGAGQLGNGELNVDNRTAGVIDATGANALVVNPGVYTISSVTHNETFTNEGVMEATNPGSLAATGGLILNGATIDNTGGSNAGKIEALGTLTHVDLQHNASIRGGTLITSGGGVITTDYGNVGTLDGSAVGAAVTISTGSLVQVANYTDLHILGTVVNNGTIFAAGVANQSYLDIDGAAVTLTGSGLVQLNDDANGNAVIRATVSGDKLVNLNNTIAGGGTIGLSGLSVDNRAAGTINANGVNHSLVLTGTTAFTNEGLIESTSATGLEIRSITLTNLGTVQGVAGGIVDIENAAITGGVLNGAFTTVYGEVGTLDGSSRSVTSNGTVSIVNYSNLYLAGTLYNRGTMADLGAANGSYLVANSATVTLTGAGLVSLNDEGNGNAVISAGTSGEKLVNVNNTISGAGTIGYGGLVFDNQVAGTINANGIHHSLVLTGSTGFTNEGLIETTTTASLEIRSILLTNSGTVQGITGGTVLLENATIAGGKLNGAFSTVYGENATLDGSAAAVTSNGTITIANYSNLYLDGTLINKGLIASVGTANGSFLDANSAVVTLTGGGQVSMIDDGNGNALIAAAASGNKLINVNNTIFGAGTIGYGGLAFDNQAAGVIDATGITHSLVLTGSSSFTNEGLIETTSSSGLEIRNIVLTNSGTIQGLAGGTVSIENAVIAGGVLNGAFTTVFGENGTLDGSANAVTSTGTVTIHNYSDLYVIGTLVNQGTIANDGTANPSFLEADSAVVTLTGGGQVSLIDDGNGNALIAAATSGNKLINVNNTIFGAGTIGYGGLAFDNQAAGVIDATGITHSLVLTGSSSFTNEGLIETTGGSGLEIRSITLSNTGTIQGIGGGTVYIEQASVAGGTLNGQFTTVTGQFGSTLDGSAHVIASTGTVTLVNYSALTLLGTINNTGLITDLASANGTYIYIGSPATTLTGNGTVSLDGTSNAIITGTVATNKLVNAGNTIIGGGLLGNNALLLDNRAGGVINANIATGLTISPNGTFSNEGLVEDTGTGGLIIQNATLTNTGSILANGGVVTIGSTDIVTNIAGGTLTAGTWGAISSTLTVFAGPVAVDAGTITLSGTSSVMTFAGVAIDTTLTTVAAGGALNILGGRNFFPTNTITDSGRITLGGGNWQSPGTLTVTGTGTLSGFGLVLGTVSSGGLLDASGGGTLDVVNPLVLTNALEADTNSVLQLVTTITSAGSITLNGVGSEIQFGTSGPFTPIENTLNTITSTGTFSVIGGRGYTTALSLTDSGTFKVGGGTFSLGGLTVASGALLTGYGDFVSTVANAGSLSANGGLLTLAAGETGAGALSSQVGATLEIGASSSVGALTDKGVVQLDGNTYSATSLTILAGATLIGSGTLNTAAANSGTIEAHGGLLKLAAAPTGGSGTLIADAGSTLELAVNTTAGTVLDNGVLLIDGKIGAFAALTVGAGGTLFGTGTLSKAFANAGLVEANGGTLTLSLGATGPGTLQSDAGALLSLAAGVDTASTLTANGNVTMNGGSLTAAAISIGAAGKISGKGTITGTIANAGLLDASGGTLAVTGAVSGTGILQAETNSVLQLSTGITIATDITLNGIGSELQFGKNAPFTLLENSLIKVAAGGTLAVLGGRGYVTTKAFTDSGLIKAGGGTFTFGSLQVAAGSQLSGSGVFTNAITGGGTLTANSGLLQLAGGITGGDALNVLAGATLELGAASTSGTVADKGVLKLDGISENATKLSVVAGATLIGSGTLVKAVTLAGTIEASGGLLTLGNGDTGTSGTLQIDAAGTLELAGNTTAASVIDNGVLQLDNKIGTFTAMTVAAAAKVIGSGTIAKAFSNAGLVEGNSGTLKLTLGATGTGTLQVDAGATLSLANGIDTAGSVVANGVLSLTTLGSLSVAGTLTVGAAGQISGAGTVTGPIANAGTIVAHGGVLHVASAVTGSGSFSILAASTLDLGGATAQNVVYGTGTAMLQLDAQASFTGAVSGLAVGDAINFASETVTSATVSSGTLTVVGSAGTTTYAVSGALAGNHFAIAANQHKITLTTGAQLALASPAFVAASAPQAAPAAVPLAPMSLADATGLAAWSDSTGGGGGGASTTLDAHGAGLAWLDSTQPASQGLVTHHGC